MRTDFESPCKGKLLSEHVPNPDIEVGRYSYCPGYYHGHPFDTARAGNTVIGHDVWIGAQAMFTHGAVIGIRAVVTKDATPQAASQEILPARSESGLLIWKLHCCWKCSGGIGILKKSNKQCHCFARRILPLSGQSQ